MASTRTQSSAFSFWSPISRCKHDVFLSFRGEDTRNNITEHLHTALSDAGISTFRDNQHLAKGGELASELLKAIQMSRIAIIVFSKNYASSSWCLDELVKIVECKKVAGQVVLPVFYDVDPSDVRQQKGGLGKDLSMHEERLKLETSVDLSENKVERWRAALTEAASLSGWDLQNVSSWHRSKFIKEIVKVILSRHQDAHMSVSIFPTGIDAGKEYLNLLLSVISDDVLVIGINGMGKLGKTTIARAVYNQNFQKFEYSSFLGNVKAVADKPNGIVCLQKQLLSDILMETNIEIGDASEGIELIKNTLHRKRVLVVLDDVSHLDQLNALARKRDWFGSGSRIVITTRDARLLNVLEVDDVYGAQGIQVIENQFRQNICKIEELKESIQRSHVQTHERVGFLIAAIERERQKNATQAQIIAKLRQCSREWGCSSSAMTMTVNAIRNGNGFYDCEAGGSDGAKLDIAPKKQITRRGTTVGDEEGKSRMHVHIESNKLAQARVEMTDHEAGKRKKLLIVQGRGHPNKRHHLGSD